MTDVENLKAERERIEKWRDANMDKIGGAEFRRSTRILRLLCDLIARNGGSGAERTYVADQLAAMEEEKRAGR